MHGKVLDRFEDLSGWAAFASGDARLEIHPDEGVDGKAMRLDFDFHGGGGFVVARKLFPLELPETYSFGFRIRGVAPPNIFEFKLVDESNRNVWRYRVDDFEFPQQWQPVTIRNSQIEFAWGPLGGGPAQKVAAIELVIAAGAGGKGTVWIEGLWLKDDTYRATPLVRASSALPGRAPAQALNSAEGAGWRSVPSEGPAWLLVDFQQEREYGGVVIQWEKGLSARAFEVQVSSDGVDWRTAYVTTQGGSERSYLYLPQTVSRYLRLILSESSAGQGFGVRGIEVKPYEFSRSLNHFFQHLAREQARGLNPRYLSTQQSYWTPVGTGEGDGEALCNEEGMVEVDRGSFSLAPYLFAKGRLWTWADVALTQELAKGYLPIPSSIWRSEDFILTTTAFAAGTSGGPVLFVRYCLENPGRTSLSAVLFAALLPFQVTPTWQNWRAFGGVTHVRELSYRCGAVWVNGNKVVIPLTAARGFGAAPFARGGVTNFLIAGKVPQEQEVSDEFGYGSGALRFDLDVAPGDAEEVYLAVPFGALEHEERPKTLWHELSGPAHYAEALRSWEARLDGVSFQVPAHEEGMVATFKTAAAHILVNRDGPALHPGPRRYSRAWIRDGVIMGAALLRLGETAPMRDFIRWYAQFQAEDGNIPDCADREGTEWLPEFDAYGQFIYGVMEYYRFSGDREFLEEMRPAVTKTLAYMEGLRSRRLTPEYQTAEKRACYGLLPESMSHEGYMAHPVHAFWDDFWALRGLRDAAVMAEVLGDRQEAARLVKLGDEFSGNLRESLTATIERHTIDYVPGSVELGDFDPTATSVAISLLDQLHLLPQPETTQTFDKYLAGFRERASGRLDWNNYSAYEIRIIGALVRLGRVREALELTRFMLDDRRIPAWNQWPEISWRDPRGPSFIGDLPHTWISAEYLIAVRSFFAYEREADESLVIAAGIGEEWLAEGREAGVENLPTHYGKLSYVLRMEEDGVLHLRLWGDLIVPAGGIVVQPFLSRPLREVTLNGNPLTAFTAESFTCRECPAEVLMKL